MKIIINAPILILTLLMIVSCSTNSKILIFDDCGYSINNNDTLILTIHDIDNIKSVIDIDNNFLINEFNNSIKEFNK